MNDEIKDMEPVFYIIRRGSTDVSLPNDMSFPAFVLEEDAWDDYSVRSQFNMIYMPDGKQFATIGDVKIILKNQAPPSSYDWTLVSKTAEYLPSSFKSLKQFGGCSLGQTDTYYYNLRKYLGQKDCEHVLSLLCDCALFPTYQMPDHPCFHSLIRSDEAERLLRTAKLKIYGMSESEIYRCNYHFKTPYNSDEVLEMQCDFRQDTNLAARRVYAIIGENGTGKTQLLNQFPVDYANKDADVFNGPIPRYSKIIKVASSFFDDYTDPAPDDSCEFVYCGFRRHDIKEIEDVRTLLQKRLSESIDLISSKIREQGAVKLHRALKQFIPEECLDEIFSDTYEIRKEQTFAVVSKMSSGESNMFYTICDIIAHIRYDTLILFDEPEVHMHPNAICTFMNILYTILEEYSSFAIIATHSPLIVREIMGDHVYVMERIGNVPSLRKIGMESFAANLTDLYNEIFSGTRTTNYYKSLIHHLRKENKTAEEVEKLLKSENLDLNLNMQLMIMNMFQAKNEEGKAS